MIVKVIVINFEILPADYLTKKFILKPVESRKNQQLGLKMKTMVLGSVPKYSNSDIGV